MAAEKERPQPAADGTFHVRPGESIQAALDAASLLEKPRRIVVHAGTYRPEKPGHALLVFLREHDGIELQAAGEVVLQGSNSELNPHRPLGFPGAVNHIMVLGSGISQRTKIQGFTFSEANGYAHDKLPNWIDRITPPKDPRKPGLFFFLDGGAIKVFADCAPTIENCVFQSNRSRLCGGAISVEQRGLNREPVVIRNCVFRQNSCPATGSAIDVLEGSAAEITNCLFVENFGNFGMNEVHQQYGLSYNSRHGCGALTVFPNSRVVVRRCTFARNANGVDDRGQRNVYEACLFSDNTLPAGKRPGDPYEMDILDATNVSQCVFHGKTPDLRGTIDAVRNVLNAASPQFDKNHVPQAPACRHAGYRPHQLSDRVP